MMSREQVRNDAFYCVEMSVSLFHAHDSDLNATLNCVTPRNELARFMSKECGSTRKSSVPN